MHYRLRDQAALDDYLRDHASHMHATGITRFGAQASERPRSMAQREEFIRGKVSTENCLNCGEVLTGQHCSHCGQRATVRVLSLWGMLRDVLGDITNFDSRLWRTLLPLAFRPGVLTQDYLRGRRASYTPPFRMYLILSVAFFLLATLGGNPGADLDVQRRRERRGEYPAEPWRRREGRGRGREAGNESRRDPLARRRLNRLAN